MIMKNLKPLMRLLTLSCNRFGTRDGFSWYPSDVLISDICEDDLHREISQNLKKKYLSPLSQGEKEFERIRKGILYGINCRVMISLPTCFKNRKPIWVHYLIDTGSPYTTLTIEAIQSLISPTANFNGGTTMKINGFKTNIHLSTNHYRNINIIGMNYLMHGKYVLDNIQNSAQIIHSTSGTRDGFSWYPSDVLISDICKDDLHREISQNLKKKYLSPLSQGEKEFERIRKGIVYGRKYRAMISLPTRYRDRKPIWIHYLIDTGSPNTTLTVEAIQALGSSAIEMEKTMETTMKINGFKTKINLSTNHYKDFNLLGMSYLMQGKSIFDGIQRSAQIIRHTQ